MKLEMMGERSQRRRQSAFLYLIVIICTTLAYKTTQIAAREPYRLMQTLPVSASEIVHGTNPTVSCNLGRIPYCGVDYDGVWSSLRLGYLKNLSDYHMCHVSLFRTSAQRVADAVRNNCVYHLQVSGYRVAARLGVIDDDDKPRVFTHFDLHLQHVNDGRVLGVQLRQEKAIPYDNGDLGYTLSSTWTLGTKEQHIQTVQLFDINMLINAFLLIGSLAHSLLRSNPNLSDSAQHFTCTAGGGGAISLSHIAHSIAVGVGAHALVAALIQPGSLRFVLLTAPVCGAVSASILGRAQITARLSVAIIAPLIVPFLQCDGIVDDGVIIASSVALSIISFMAQSVHMTGTTIRRPLGASRTSLRTVLTLSLAPAFAIAPFIVRSLQALWTHTPPNAASRVGIAIYAISALLTGALGTAFGCGRYAVWCTGAISAAHVSIFGVFVCTRLPSELPSALTGSGVIGKLACMIFVGGTSSTIGGSLLHGRCYANKAAVS